MKVERWETEKHMPLLGRWLRGHGMPDDGNGADLYPATGYVVDGCVVGFLYRTDAPGVGWLDSIVGDPDVPRERRRAALDMLLGLLFEAAEQASIRLVWGTTSVPSIAELSQARGAKVYQTGHVCLAWSPRRRI